jgi:hypothetical protein
MDKSHFSARILTTILDVFFKLIFTVHPVTDFDPDLDSKPRVTDPAKISDPAKVSDPYGSGSTTLRVRVA